MFNFVNGRCKAVLWLTVFVFSVNCGRVLTESIPEENGRTPHKIQNNYVRSNHNQQQSSERRGRQQFPFVNNPGQQILDKIKNNLGMNSNVPFGISNNANFKNPFANNNFGNFAQQAAQNTYNILNKTFENLNQFSMGNFGNFLQQQTTGQPNFPITTNGVSTSVPVTPTSVPIVPTSSSMTPTNKGDDENYKNTSPSPTDDNNISHYINGDFPVIHLRPEEIKK